jgi:hypothetical protein
MKFGSFILYWSLKGCDYRGYSISNFNFLIVVLGSTDL